MSLLNLMSGVPDAVKRHANELARELNALAGVSDRFEAITRGLDLATDGAERTLDDLSGTDIEMMGPPTEETTTGYTEEWTGTGAIKKPVQVKHTVQKPTRAPVKHAAPHVDHKAQQAKSQVRQASSQAKQQVNQVKDEVAQRVGKVEAAVTDIFSALKDKGLLKNAALGNRAAYTNCAINVAAAGVTTAQTVVANASAYYDRMALNSNVPGLFQNLTAAGNPLLDGNQSISTDAGQVVGPIELAQPLQISGTSGTTITFTNRGAGAGDGTLFMIPTNQSYGSYYHGASAAA